MHPALQIQFCIFEIILKRTYGTRAREAFMTKIDLRGSGYDSTGYQPTEEVVDDKGQSFQRSSIFSRPKANDSTSLTGRSDSLSGGDANLLQWANEYYLSGGGSGNGVSGYRPDDHESAGDEPVSYTHLTLPTKRIV